MTKTERIEIRVTKELKQEVQALAAEQQCTVSRLIEKLLIDEIRANGIYIPGVSSYFKSLKF